MHYIAKFFLIALFSASTSVSAGSQTDRSSLSLGASSLEGVPIAAPGSLGFRLAGIVVADETATNLAVIEHENESGQRVYRQGDRANGVLIKQILPNELIVDAGEGDRRLPVSNGVAASGPRPAEGPVPRQGVQQDAASSPRISGRHRVIDLDRSEVAVALADVNQVLAQVNLSPVTRFDGPGGFRITNIPTGGILSQLGLHDGDVIQRLDDAEFTHPEQAAELLERMRNGGELTMTVNKRRRTRQIILNIH